jgi:DNA-binding NarL/FixJ family response regulator
VPNGIVTGASRGLGLALTRALAAAEKTVKTHVGHLLAKLGVTDRTQAAVQAVRAGLVRS